MLYGDAPTNDDSGEVALQDYQSQHVGLDEVVPPGATFKDITSYLDCSPDLVWLEIS
jgi:hypothetical protein